MLPRGITFGWTGAASTAMLMDQPQDAEAPAVSARGHAGTSAERLGYNAVARLAGADCGRFVAAADFLRAQGLSAPAIYAADVKRGFVSDRGSGRRPLRGRPVERLPTDEHALYGAAIDALGDTASRARRLRHWATANRFTPMMKPRCLPKPTC